MLRNRHGEEYDLVKIEPNKYLFVAPNEWLRFGGKEGQDCIDYSDLGFIDPSGGPFISVGSMINGEYVTNISSTLESIIITTRTA